MNSSAIRQEHIGSYMDLITVWGSAATATLGAVSDDTVTVSVRLDEEGECEGRRAQYRWEHIAEMYRLSHAMFDALIGIAI